MSRPAVLLVGDFMLDEYCFGDAERISPEAPIPVLRVVRREVRPGGAGSVAQALIALQGEVYCCGVIGDDRAGLRLRDDLAGQGCEVSGLLTEAGRPTTHKLRLVGLAQHRHPQQLLRVDQEQSAPIADATQAQLARTVEQFLPRAAIVCMEDYAKGVLGAQWLGWLIRQADQAQVLTIVDPALGADYRLYAGASCITPNRNEAGLATGKNIETIDDAATAAQILQDRFALRNVIITLDRQGMYALDGSGHGRHIPTTARRVYDVTGAGDVVLAALAVGLGCGWTLSDAAGLANVAAGIEVERFGVTPVTREEIMEWLSHHGGSVSKIKPRSEVVAQAQRARRAGQTLVFANGCFDILHPGHVALLERARSFGDLLIVGLNSDQSARQLAKGPGRPINPERERATVLAGLQAVDFVTLFDEPTPLELIRALQPHVLVKGSDWKDKGVIGRELVEAAGGRVEFVELLGEHSTSGLLERIRQADSPEGSVPTPEPVPMSSGQTRRLRVRETGDPPGTSQLSARTQPESD